MALLHAFGVDVTAGPRGSLVGSRSLSDCDSEPFRSRKVIFCFRLQILLDDNKIERLEDSVLMLFDQRISVNLTPSIILLSICCLYIF